MKKFKMPTGQLIRLIGPVAGVRATYMIIVDGKDVGYVYREEPINGHDTGWRFFAGEESPEYVNDTGNTEFYDINTVANCDPSIIAFKKLKRGVITSTLSD
jgi:hypothetical protein